VEDVFRCSSGFSNVGGEQLRAQEPAPGTQAIPAGSDAGSVVPLQSGMRGLRQGAVSGTRTEGPAHAEECFRAVDEAGAPIVNIPGGEPLLHPQIGEIVEGLIARGKYVYLCTNALLLKEKMHLFKPSKYFTLQSIWMASATIMILPSPARRVRRRRRGDEGAIAKGSGLQPTPHYSMAPIRSVSAASSTT